jgi:hypothetical protein
VSPGKTIENRPLLEPLTGAASQVTLSLAAFVGGPVTTQLNVPAVALLFCTDAASTCDELPPLRDSSIFTTLAAPRL